MAEVKQHKEKAAQLHAQRWDERDGHHVATAQALADAEMEGKRHEQARWEAEIDSILNVAGDVEKATLHRLRDLMRGKASYQPSALDEAIADAEERGRREAGTET